MRQNLGAMYDGVVTDYAGDQKVTQRWTQYGQVCLSVVELVALFIYLCNSLFTSLFIFL